MGLDITAYSNLTYIGVHEPADDWLCGQQYDDETGKRNHMPAYAYKAFPHALKGLRGTRLFATKHGDRFLYGGCFTATDRTETHGFRAGSYSGYGDWLQRLAELFNPYRRRDGRPSPRGPFYELIWFADNEGTIATEAARSLLADFRTHESVYIAAARSGAYADYNIGRYRDWTRACELAAADGLIDFH